MPQQIYLTAQCIVFTGEIFNLKAQTGDHVDAPFQHFNAILDARRHGWRNQTQRQYNGQNLHHDFHLVVQYRTAILCPGIFVMPVGGGILFTIAYG